MLSHELAIEQREVAGLQSGHKPRQRDFGCIGRAAEHALAEERATELHAVEAAYQFIALPDLDRVRVTRAVKRNHCMLELGVDPGFLALGTRRDHAGKGTVMRHGEPVGPERPAKRPRNMEAVERNNCAVPGLDPEQLLGIAAVGHREDARRVALEQEARVEATHRAKATESRAPCPAGGTGGRPFRFRRSGARSGSGESPSRLAPRRR